MIKPKIKIKIKRKKKNLLNLNKLSINKKSNLIVKIYKRFNFKRKFKKFKVLNRNVRLKIFFNKLKKYYPVLLNKIPLKKLVLRLKNVTSKTKRLYRPLNQIYKSNNKFLTKRLRKVLNRFPKVDIFNKTKNKLKRRVAVMNRLLKKKKLRKNLSKRTFFFRIIRKTRRHKIKMLRLNRTKPIFTKKTKKEKKFLFKARESLLKTKKYLYRKQFPKIKGKKNKNFNFYYYNNMDRLPFKFHIGRIVITYLLNNTFINIHNSKKMLKVLSAGKLGFKGPKRSTPYSRQIVARKAIKFITKTKMNVLDIFLNSNYNRWYYFLFKEISKPKVKPYVIRYLVISNPRAHGFIRDRKHRRK